jgi:predicted Zn finger-like uncharacterized protein
MILTCPNCATQYDVADGSIPPQGRKVRCASCGESWFQDGLGETATETDAEPEPTDGIEGPADESVDIEVVVEDDSAGQSPYDSIPEPEADEDESFAEASLIEPRSGPEAEQRAYEESVVADAAAPAPAEEQAAADWSEPPGQEEQGDEYPAFIDRYEEAPRARRPWLPFLIVLVIVAALSALFWFAAPEEWKSRLGIASGASPLRLVTTHMDRQRLESGNELLTVTGRVINPTGREQDVPPLTAELRNRGGAVVYRWTIAPPARSLAPGASASFNSAEVNVPPGGEAITITLGGRAV